MPTVNHAVASPMCSQRDRTSRAKISAAMKSEALPTTRGLVRAASGGYSIEYPGTWWPPYQKLSQVAKPARSKRSVRKTWAARSPVGIRTSV